MNLTPYMLGGLLAALVAFTGPVSCAHAQTISTHAGGFNILGDGGPAISAALDHPEGMAVAIDKAGNVYIVDTGNCVIRKVATDGIISTIAGNGCNAGPFGTSYGGDGGPATAATMRIPRGLAIDDAGNLYVADSGNFRIRKISTAGVITTIAGNGVPGNDGDGGPATDARLIAPSGVSLDGAGNLFIADYVVIRKVSTDGKISTVAGNGIQGYSGDGGPGVDAELSSVQSVAADGAGNLYIADLNSSRIRKLTADGIITTFVETSFPNSVALDAAGNLYIASAASHIVRKISTAGAITAVAGSGNQGYSGDGGPATVARLFYPSGAAVDSAGNLFVNDAGNDVIRKVSTNGAITAFAGNGTTIYLGDGLPATRAALNFPLGLAFDPAGNLYIADSLHNRIRKVSPSGVMTTAVEQSNPGAIAADKAGNVYFVGLDRSCVCEMKADGTRKGILGACDASAGGNGVSAELNTPYGIAVDDAGNLYIADSSNNVIRKFSTNGEFSTVVGNGDNAGTGHGSGFGGDGGPALSAELSIPTGVALDGKGNLYVADTFNQRIRKVAADGTINTIAGNGVDGYSGDGGPAIAAELNHPFGVAVDAAGNVYVGDSFNNRIRKITTDGTIITIAGNGFPLYTGDGGPPTSAALFDTIGLALDNAGNLFIADSGNNAIRKISSVDLAGRVNLDQHGITGSWFNPMTGGQGLEIEVYPDLGGAGRGLLFAGWFTYDIQATGGRRWYGVSGDVGSASYAKLQIYDVEGGRIASPPALGAHGPLGEVTLNLGDCNTGSLTYAFNDGRHGAMPLIRLAPNVTCSPAGGSGAAGSTYLLSGNWYNPATSGQGFMFDFSPSISYVFGAWYTFWLDGQQRGGPSSQDWFTLQSDQFSPGTTALDNIAILEASDGIFDFPESVTVRQVGTASIAFKNCGEMTLGYHFTVGPNIGLVGSMDLIRTGPTPKGCSLQ